MKLNEESLKTKTFWNKKGYILPEFDREKMIETTIKTPTWVHFGGGNLFRAYHAVLAQRLLDNGDMAPGITVVEGFDYEIVEKMYRPNGNLSIAVTLKSDGTIDKRIVGSIGESCLLDSENEAEFTRLKDIFTSDSLQMATFTITEKGYALTDAKGVVLPAVDADLKAGPEKPGSYIGKVAALLYARYKAGKKPIAMVSTDNCSHNGDKLYNAMIGFAKAWAENGTGEAGFVDYVESKDVSFPWSMIDKITPRPDASVEKLLLEDGLEDLEPVITTKKSYVAKFVNAEETEYLVIEDDFPNGRPALEKVGVIFTDRETVDKVETMKVGTCLNPLHTCLAVFGCILGHTKISGEMKDPELVGAIRRLGYVEGLPVVVNPGVLDPKEFIDTCINVRFPNPFMPDTPQRIATDTSQKLSVRYGTTLSKYLENKMDLNDLKVIPMIFAGWVRYLTGVGDDGKKFELSPDPLLEEVLPYVEGLTKDNVDEKIRPLLKNKVIFKYDLEEIGLADRVLEYLGKMLEGEGAVRKTIKEIIA